MSDKNLTVFVDGIGRTVVGEVVDDNDTTLVVKNPSIIHVVPNPQTGQISVQLLPFFFKEFTKSTAGDVDWTFNKATLTTNTGIDLDDKIVTQYSSMYSPIIAPDAVGAGGDPKVVKLFDD